MKINKIKFSTLQIIINIIYISSEPAHAHLRLSVRLLVVLK